MTSKRLRLKYMPEKENETAIAKAWVFFERAQKVARSNNFDYAIEMYLEGLRCAPDELDKGHFQLHQLALARQVKGGKKPSMMEKVKLLRGKNPLDKMLNAEYLFAKDPDHLPYVEAMLKAAVEGDYKKTAKWIADLVFAANNAVQRPSFQIYITLKDSYAAIGQFDRAIAACQHAARLKPQDGELADEFRRLSAELTVSRGKYDKATDFRESIINREQQERLHAQQGIIKTKDYRLMALEGARKELAEAPDSDQKIFNLAQALSEMQTDEAENEAIELLEKAYEEKSDFNFKKRAGQIQIKQIKRKIRKAKAALQENTRDNNIRKHISELASILNKTEMEHYRLNVENYPTDLKAKYDYGVQLVRNKRYDEAIPLFQHAQRDPRRKIASMGKIGMCFFNKGWYPDAADVFNEAIESYEIKDNGLAKELRYNLARSLEEQGETEKTLELYRKIAQMDFNFKDVRERIDNLRKKETT